MLHRQHRRRDASENEATKYIMFEDNRWYHIKVRGRRARIEAWVDARQKYVDVDTTEKKISMRLGEMKVGATRNCGLPTRAALEK